MTHKYALAAFASLFCFYNVTVLADGLGAPFDFEDTSMLPKGVRTVKFRSFTTEVESKFDNNGTVQPLGKPFRKTLKMNSLYKDKPANEAALSKGYMQSLGINPDTTNLGTIDAYASARVTAVVPVIGIGIRENWSLAIAIPVVYSNTAADTGFNVSPQAEAFFGYLSSDTNSSTTKTAEGKLADPVNNQVTAMGYDRLDGEVRTEIGDVRFINKVLVKKEDNYAIAVKQSITAPTGKQASYNKLVAVGSGDSQWDLGASVIGDWYINGKWTLSGYGGYTVQFSDTTTKRVPVTSDSPLGYTDNNVNRDLGDMAGAGISFKYALREGWTLATSYDAQIKYSDLYHGYQYQPVQYDWLAQNTDQRMESAVFGVTYSTVPLFRKKAFPVPLDAKISYATVVGGKNVPADDIASGELAVYF